MPFFFGCAILLAILFPGLMRKLFLLFGLLVIIFIWYVSTSYQDRAQDCAAHASQDGYAMYHTKCP